MEGSTTSNAPRRTHPNPLHPAASAVDDDKVLLPLGETTLSNNLGIPVIVVVTKVSETLLCLFSVSVTACDCHFQSNSPEVF